MARLQASLDVRVAVDQFRAAQRSLVRPLADGRDRLEIADFSLYVSVPEIPEIDRIRKADAYVMKLETDLSLFVERRRYLSDAQVVSPAELQGIGDGRGRPVQIKRYGEGLPQDRLERTGPLYRRPRGEVA